MLAALYRPDWKWVREYYYWHSGSTDTYLSAAHFHTYHGFHW